MYIHKLEIVHPKNKETRQVLNVKICRNINENNLTVVTI